MQLFVNGDPLELPDEDARVVTLMVDSGLKYVNTDVYRAI